MSSVLSSKNGIRSRKKRLCHLCEKCINIGDLYDQRRGINLDGDFYVMNMHPECQAKELDMSYEEREYWYECPDGPLFDRPGKEEME